MTRDPEQTAHQLDVIVRLLAIVASEKGKTLRDRCAVLARAGLTPSLIAKILGTTANTVRVELSRQRKKPGRRGA